MNDFIRPYIALTHMYLHIPKIIYICMHKQIKQITAFWKNSSVLKRSGKKGFFRKLMNSYTSSS